MSDIILHSRLGVNPRMTVCPRCGGDGDKLMLLGSQNYKYTCRYANCGLTHYGKPTGAAARTCPGCGLAADWVNRTELDDNERLPASAPCRKCQAEIDEHKKVVAEGGIYFRCKDCKAQGVIRANELTAKVRAHAKIEPPNPVGVEFAKDDCPSCGPNKVTS